MHERFIIENEKFMAKLKEVMIIRSASYVTSSAKISQLPPPDLPEYAFIGRSNVGKSSLINMLVAKKGLPRFPSIRVRRKPSITFLSMRAGTLLIFRVTVMPVARRK